MSADTCPRCGRERGWGLTQCSPRDHESCLGFLRDRAERERDEARRDLADAKAEVERLRAEVSNLLAERDGYSAACTMSVRELAAEADELRRLAWEWCIRAAEEDERACKWADARDAAVREISALVADAERKREPRAFDAMAEQAGPLPTAVLAQTEAETLTADERSWIYIEYEESRADAVIDWAARRLPAIMAAQRQETSEAWDRAALLRKELDRLTDDAYEVDHRGNYSEPPIESLGPDVHEVALRVLVATAGREYRPELNHAGDYEAATEYAYRYARAFVDHREAVSRGEKSEWESDR